MADKNEQDKPMDANEETSNGHPEASSIETQNSSLEKSEKSSVQPMGTNILLPYEGLSESQSVYIARVNPDAIDALANKAPEQLLNFLDTNDKRLSEFSVLREGNRHQESTQIENTKRFAVGVIFISLIGVLVFAGITKDGNLAKDIITLLFTGLGGIGVGTSNLFKQSSND